MINLRYLLMENKLKNVSFLMPLFNSDIKLLKRSLDSIYQQTYQGNITIYCILDGKNNKIKKFLLNFIEINCCNNREIKLFVKENSGLSNTLNYGLNRITEDYIFRQDDDDFSLPQRVEKVLNAFKNKNCSIVATAAIFKNGENYKVKNYPKKKFDILLNLICGINPICHPTVCFDYKKLTKLLGKKISALYPNSLTEDHSLWYFLAKNDIYVKQLSFPSVIYTVRDNQYSQNIFKESRVSSLYFIKESINLLNHHKKMYIFLPLIIMFVLKRILIIKAYSLKLKIKKTILK